MTLLEVERAARSKAYTWAAANSLVFHGDNSPEIDPHKQRTLTWRFSPGYQNLLTGDVIETIGEVEASIFIPSGDGMPAALELASSLLDEFRGLELAGAEVLDPGEVDAMRVDSSHVVKVRIPWEYAERHTPTGAYGDQGFATPATAYTTFRKIWYEEIQTPLSLTTIWDGGVAASATPPFAVIGYRLLDARPVEIRSHRVHGRAIVAANYALGSGPADAADLYAAIMETYNQRTTGGVVYGTPNVIRVGRTPLATWQTNVRIPFFYEVNE